MKASNRDDLLLYAVGDVGPRREDPDSIFRYVKDTIRGGDIAFCQLEPNLSKRGTRMPQARLAMRTDPASARAIKEAGFHVVSFASNHCMDWGTEAFFDTIEALQGQGLMVLGAGKNIEEARRPVIIEAKGTSVAFLGYNTILPMGYWAEADRPGCAPLRAWTVYEQIEHDQPGTPCRIYTSPNRDDLKTMVEAINNAKKKADLVIVSIHWGIHFIPSVIADYQRTAGRAAIDAGADIILGHHAHILKGIEVYKGKAIFYSLCNFALEAPHAFMEEAEGKESRRHVEIRDLNKDIKPDDPRRMPEDTRKTIIVKCSVLDKQIKQVSFQPVYLNDDSEPEILFPDDERFNEVVDYIKTITLDQGIGTMFRIEGNEVIVETAGS
ncbi:MAG: CapA family protein [Deltaproteobacteria bacterium]|nr:CapA family protein [Deltaproteobacteria bacterium]